MKKPNRRLCRHYVVGLDLGQMMQPTAIAVIEQEVLDLHPFRQGREVRAWHLRHLDRLPLDSSYADIGARVAEVIARLEEKEQAKNGTDLVIDITGTGRPVGEVMEKAGLNPIMVTITGGMRETEAKPGDWLISKNDLVGGLQMLFQDERFKVAKGMPLAAKFAEELQTFKLRPPALNPNDPESWRERPNDDLVFAVALAAWRARRYLPTPQAVEDRWNEAMKKHDEEWAKYVV